MLPSDYPDVEIGTTAHTIHTERDAMMYGIYDHELEVLGQHSVHSQFCFAAASFCFTAAFSMLIEWRQAPEEIKFFWGTFGIAWLAGAFGATLLGMWARSKYGNLIEKIKTTSRPRILPTHATNSE